MVGMDSRQDGSVLDASLEYSDDWNIWGITGDLTWSHSEVYYFQRNFNHNSKGIWSWRYLKIFFYHRNLFDVGSYG
jgi:hypothetical protein